MPIKSAIISDKRVTMHLVRRSLLQPSPGSAEPRHAYAPVFATRAAVKTMSGTNEWNTVVIDTKLVTHLWTMRFTRLPFDSRDRIKDAEGNYYQILKVENPDLANRELKIYTAKIGSEDAPANA